MRIKQVLLSPVLLGAKQEAVFVWKEIGCDGFEVSLLPLLQLWLWIVHAPLYWSRPLFSPPGGVGMCLLALQHQFGADSRCYRGVGLSRRRLVSIEQRDSQKQSEANPCARMRTRKRSASAFYIPIA